VLVHGDHVGRLAGIDQRTDGREDQLVLMAVEVALAQQVPHAIPGIVVQQQAAEHARLGLHRMRRHAQLRHLAIKRRRGKVIIERGHHGRHGNPRASPSSY